MGSHCCKSELAAEIFGPVRWEVVFGDFSVRIPLSGDFSFRELLEIGFVSRLLITDTILSGQTP